MNVVDELSIILGLTLLNGVFAGAEIAMLAVRKTRLRQLVEQGKRSAVVALALRQDTERLLATIQIGITVIGAATAVFGGTRLQQPLADWLGANGVGAYAEQIAFGVVVALISYLSLVLGELVPKSLALQRSEQFALFVARGIFGLSKLARPIVWLLTKTSNLVLFPLRDRTTFAETRLSVDELRQLLEEAGNGGTLPADVAEIAVRTLDFAELAVHAVMIPRTRIVSLPQRMTRDALLQTLRAQRFARYPVVVENDDDIAGYVLARELLVRLAAYPHEREVDLLSLSRELPTFREQTSGVDALRRLQRGRAPIGIVSDEHGSVAGLVTVEDLAEEVLSAILEEDEVTTPLWKRETEQTFLVRGDAPLQELGRELDIDLEPKPGATTVAGLVTQTAGKIPKVGDRFEIHPFIEAEVLDANVRQVRGVRLHMLRREPPAPDT